MSSVELKVDEGQANQRSSKTKHLEMGRGRTENSVMCNPTLFPLQMSHGWWARTPVELDCLKTELLSCVLERRQCIFGAWIRRSTYFKVTHIHVYAFSWTCIMELHFEKREGGGWTFFSQCYCDPLYSRSRRTHLKHIGYKHFLSTTAAVAFHFHKMCQRSCQIYMCCDILSFQ